MRGCTSLPRTRLELSGARATRRTGAIRLSEYEQDIQRIDLDHPLDRRKASA